MFSFISPSPDDILSKSLLLAVWQGDLEKIKELIRSGANPKTLTQRWETLLHLAAQFGHAYLFDLLINDYKINVNAVDKYSNSALHNVSRHHFFSSFAAAKCLIYNGANVQAKNSVGNTPLHFACMSGQLPIAKYLIEKGANINAVGCLECIPLHYACFNLKDDIVKFLLENGANVNAIYERGETPLYHIARKWVNHTEIHKQAEQIIQLLWNHRPKANLTAFDSEELFNPLFVIWKKNSRNELIEVDLSHREMDDKALVALADALEKNHFIFKLILSNNQFSHRGLAYLAEVVLPTNTLESLDLSSNRIGSRAILYSGFQYLMNALKKNTSIERINVNNCQLDQADIQALLDFLKTRTHTTLKQIDFDISDTVFNILSESDQKLIRTTQKYSRFFDIIRQSQIQLAKYRPHLQEQELFEACMEYLNRCKEIPLWHEEMDENLNDMAAGFMEFIDAALANDMVNLPHFLREVLKIITDKYQGGKKKSPVKDSIDVFHSTVENWMNALYIASSTIKSTYVKNQIKTPTEQMLQVAKNIILGLSGFSRIVEGTGQLVEFAGRQVEAAVIRGAELISQTTDIADIMTDIHCFPKELKENIIRKFHGLTEKDKCENLINCFEDAQSAYSKFKAIARAISHHYHDGIEKLSPEEITKLAKYAFLHIAYLFMSGILLTSKQKLTAEILTKEVILWLAYVPMMKNAVRIDIMSENEKKLAGEYFIQSKIKFFLDGNQKDHLYYCAISTRYNDIFTTQNDHYPPRWATQAEIDALNNLLAALDIEVCCSQVVPSHTLVKHQFIFNDNEVLKLKEHGSSYETKLSTYQSKRKKLNGLDKRVDELEQKIKIMEQRQLKQEKNFRKKLYKKDEKIKRKNNEIIELNNKIKKMQEKSGFLNDQPKRSVSLDANKTKRRLSLWDSVTPSKGAYFQYNLLENKNIL